MAHIPVCISMDGHLVWYGKGQFPEFLSDLVQSRADGRVVYTISHIGRFLRQIEQIAIVEISG
jgi:hypothetical protein